MKSTTSKILTLTMAAAVAATAASSAQAAPNAGSGVTDLVQGYQVAANDHTDAPADKATEEGKCGEGTCGEGKCGEQE